MITLQQIKDLEPCYCPTKYLPKDWSGSITDILNITKCTVQDRLWVATRLLDDTTGRLFAVYCAREALKLVSNPDVRSVEACNVAERYALGKATKEDLEAAAEAAWAAWAAETASRAARDKQINWLLEKGV